MPGKRSHETMQGLRSESLVKLDARLKALEDEWTKLGRHRVSESRRLGTRAFELQNEIFEVLWMITEQERVEQDG